MKDIDDAIILSEEIVASLSVMTSRQRTVVLAAMLGFTQAEIGTMLGVGQPAVSKMLKASKKFFARSVE